MGVKKLLKRLVTLVLALALSLPTVLSPKIVSAEEPSTDGRLNLNKTIELQSDGNYKIKLEAYATGKDTTTQVASSTPLDIVLVLDQSGSMSENMSKIQYKKVLTSSNKYSEAYNNRNNLYYKDGEEYYKVTVNNNYHRGHFSNWQWVSGYYTYTITYTKEGGTTVTLVDDQEDSNLPGDFYQSSTSQVKRLDALVSAVNNFVDSVEEDATKNKVDHRIAVAGFSSEGYNNTEILSGVTINTSDNTNIDNNNTKYYPDGKAHNGVQYNSTGYTTAVTNALQDVSTESGKTSVSNAISALTAHGGTRTDQAMQMAKDILDNNPKKDDSNREQIVVMFTDGEPTGIDYTNQFDSKVANGAISAAKTIKQSASIYTIGIFDGANPTTNDNPNNFMNYVSSNYKDAESMTTPNSKTGSDYYKTASNASSLSSVFEQIFNDVTSSSSSVTLKSDSVLKDIVSANFELPEGANVSDITVSTAESKYTDGNLGWKNPIKQNNMSVSISDDKKTINVSGFDYSDKYVTPNHPGQKLIVEFLVNGLKSGKQLDSNGEKSGIYVDANATDPVDTFEQPKVDIPEYSYVLDYGKKVNIPNKDENTKNVYDANQTKDYSATTIMNSSKAAPTKDTSIKGNYGTFVLENSGLTYQPGKINWDGFDSVFTFGTKSDNKYEWYKTNVIPATSVYYEDDFGTDENTDSNVAIVWTGKWDSATDGNKGDNTQGTKNEQYGWDSSYSNENKFSNGSAHMTNDASSATFTFTGTGVDVYSKTDGKVGLIRAQLYKNGSNSAMKTFYIDNISASGEYYQIPTLSFKDLDYGTYKVVIRAGGKGSSGGTTYYLDGIRVYNPLGVAPSDTTIKNAYTQAGEYNATFKEVRDLLLDAQSFNGNSIENGVVFIDKTKSGTSVSSNEIGTYKDYGPKNEVYLASGQSIAFEVNSGYEKLFVGAKSPTGNSTTMTVTDGNSTKDVTINHTSDMYYEVNAKDNGNGKKVVVIKNTGENLLSITKIRATGDGYTMSLTSSPELMSYVTKFSSLQSVKTDESGMAVAEENTKVEVDNESNQENNTTNTETNKEENNKNTTTSIWNKVTSSIKNWFRR